VFYHTRKARDPELTLRSFRYNDLLLSALSDRGYKKMFLWTDDVHDADLAPVNQSKDVYDQVASSYPAPHIILDHSVYNSTVNDVVPYGVTKLKDQGYQLVSVNTCIGDQGEWPYEWVGEPQSGDWQC
jgi:peptidoglycan/xylan/chitin deacetylase (PgdA/CDA1 family)